MEGIKEQLADEMKKRGVQGDAYMEENKRTEVAANDGAIDRVLEADSFGLGLRLFKDGRMGFGYTTLKAASEVQALFDRVEKSAYAGGYEGYALKKLAAVQKLKISDPAYGRVTIKEKQERALTLEAAVKGASGRVKYARDTTCVDNFSRITYMNSAGADYSYEKTHSFAYTSAVASDGVSDEVVDGFSGGVDWAGVDVEALGKKTGERAASLLGGGPVKSGRYTIILPPQVAVEFLQVISPMFSGTNLRKGKTLLKDAKKGETLAPDFISLVDDAAMDKKPGSFPVDGEGTAGSRNHLIKDGKFSSFLYDMASAAHFNTAPTGSAVRASFKALPETGVSNFYLEKGRDTAAGIMKTDNAILVNSLMGLHMTDTVSGNFSLGANGWLMQGGEKTRPVKEILVTGNVREFLSSISAAGDDLEFYMNFGSPTLSVRDIMVAGR